MLQTAETKISTVYKLQRYMFKTKTARNSQSRVALLDHLVVKGLNCELSMLSLSNPPPVAKKYGSGALLGQKPATALA